MERFLRVDVGVGVVAESDWSGEDMVAVRHVGDERWPQSVDDAVDAV